MTKMYYSVPPYKRIRIFNSYEYYAEDFQKFRKDNPKIIYPVCNSRQGLLQLMIAIKLSNIPDE